MGDLSSTVCTWGDAHLADAMPEPEAGGQMGSWYQIQEVQYLDASQEHVNPSFCLLLTSLSTWSFSSSHSFPVPGTLIGIQPL